MYHGFGWVPSLPDFRDFLHRPDMSKPIPNVIDLSANMPPVGDQGDLGSCTAWASTEAWEYVHTKEGFPLLQGSKLAQYFWTRLMERTTQSDAGGTLRDAIKVLVKTGMAPEELWPYDIQKFAVPPPNTVLNAAKTHLALEYQKVAVNPSAILNTLNNGNVVVFGISVYSSFMDAKGGMIPMPSKTDKFEGGHAVTICGSNVSKQLFKVQNSWGPDWGDNGFFYLPFSYIHSGLADDAWTILKV